MIIAAIDMQFRDLCMIGNYAYYIDMNLNVVVVINVVLVS